MKNLIIKKAIVLFRHATYRQRFTRVSPALSFIFFLLVMASCDPVLVFEKNVPIDPQGWQLANKIPFELDVKDTLALLNFYINIRHTTDYKYRNIFLFMDTFFPEGSQSRDTIEIILADVRGKWFGKGISSIRSNQVLLKRGFSFPMKGHYKFRLEQGMREPELTEIMDVGIRIERM